VGRLPVDCQESVCVALPEHGRLAGIDYGTVRVGIAISDIRQTISAPHELMHRSTVERESAHFRQLVENEQLCGFVVGLPLHISGDESEKSKEAREYGGWLEETTGLPVAFHDERYTSSEADELMLAAGLTSKKRKEKRDKLAAHLILASFLRQKS